MDYDMIYAAIAVFLIAATPFTEIWIAIPTGIGLGLDPVSAAVIAALGNIVPMVLIILAFERVGAWYKRRFGTNDKTRNRFGKIWDRYGLPAAAFVAPVSVGTHMALLMVLAAGTDARLSLKWMSISIVVWALVMTPLSVLGFEILT
ncbi:MAG: hypothetical protein PWQ88_1136 [Candidatus Methanomethylophilaceae archaeon]|nr:hypothetical protein [Candidatus Methanomethylophilaceae archaeon]